MGSKVNKLSLKKKMTKFNNDDISSASGDPPCSPIMLPNEEEERFIGFKEEI
jgi:hypothetical protein